MTKLIQGLRNLPYRDRLKKLKLDYLDRRIVRGDMVEYSQWIKEVNMRDLDKTIV